MSYGKIIKFERHVKFSKDEVKNLKEHLYTKSRFTGMSSIDVSLRRMKGSASTSNYQF